MLRTLFGEIQTGKLRRLPSLGWVFAVSVLFVLVGLGIGVAVGVAERMVGGDIAHAQNVIA